MSYRFIVALCAFALVVGGCAGGGAEDATEAGSEGAAGESEAPATDAAATPESSSEAAASEAAAIETVEGVTFQAPWYVYDSEACRFVETEDHPSEYVAELKETSDLRLVYLPEGDQAEFDTVLNASIEEAADRAGMGFEQFSMDFPDTQRPLEVARQAVTVEADVVISGNVLSDQYPQIQQVFEQACVPFLNQYNVPGTTDVPAFQADNYLTGAIEAEAAASIIEERGWPLDEIRIVTCTDPAVTTEPGTVYDFNRWFRETLVELLGLSEDQIVSPDLVCTTELGAERARQSMADWLTANPDASHVVGTTHIDDLYSLGLANALRDAGFEDRALVVGRGGGSATLEAIAAGDPILAVSGNPVFEEWGAPIVAMAQDVALGQPVPALVSPPVVAVTEENVQEFVGE